MPEKKLIRLSVQEDGRVAYFLFDDQLQDYKSISPQDALTFLRGGSLVEVACSHATDDMSHYESAATTMEKV